MKRTIKKQFWFSRDEAQDLQKKAKKTCLSEAALVRLLLRGYEPKEKPDDRFYDAMREFSAIGNNIHITPEDTDLRQGKCPWLYRHTEAEQRAGAPAQVSGRYGVPVSPPR